MGFKIDIAKLEEILRLDPQQEETSEIPNFHDSNGAISETDNPDVVITDKTRILNLEVQNNNLYNLISRLADEMRNQRQSINEIAVRANLTGGVRM